MKVLFIYFVVVAPQENCSHLSKVSILTENSAQFLSSKTPEWGEVTVGVPQGSILGPLFVPVYISETMT